MRVKVLRNTVASGKDIFEGTIVDVSDKDARILVALGKVRTLTEADAALLEKAMTEETERVLKGLVEEKPAASLRPQDSGKQDKAAGRKANTAREKDKAESPVSDPTTQGPNNSTDSTDSKQNGGA